MWWNTVKCTALSASQFSLFLVESFLGEGGKGRERNVCVQCWDAAFMCSVVLKHSSDMWSEMLCWTWRSLWVPSKSGYSVILWMLIFKCQNVGVDFVYFSTNTNTYCTFGMTILTAFFLSVLLGAFSVSCESIPPQTCFQRLAASSVYECTNSTHFLDKSSSY